jgi:GTP-binding nuclear protein Ran
VDDSQLSLGLKNLEGVDSQLEFDTVTQVNPDSLITADNFRALSVENDTIQEFKLIFLGSGAVGKTSFAKRLWGGEFEKKHVATNGVTVHPVLFHTNQGPIKFNIWDTVGQEKFGGLPQNYLMRSNAAIIMFDVMASMNYSKVPNWHCDLIRSLKGNKIPIILAQKKCEVSDANRNVKAHKITFHQKYGYKYFDILVESNINIEETILYIAQQLSNDKNLHFVNQSVVQQLPMPMPYLEDDDDDDNLHFVNKSVVQQPLIPMPYLEDNDDNETSL